MPATLRPTHIPPASHTACIAHCYMSSAVSHHIAVWLFAAGVGLSDRAQQTLTLSAFTTCANRCEALSRWLQELKPDTEIITAVRGAVPPEQLLRLSTFSLEKTIQQQPNFVGGGGHGHPHAHTRLGFGTVGVELSEKPLSWVTHAFAICVCLSYLFILWPVRILLALCVCICIRAYFCPSQLCVCF